MPEDKVDLRFGLKIDGDFYTQEEGLEHGKRITALLQAIPPLPNGYPDTDALTRAVKEYIRGMPGIEFKPPGDVELEEIARRAREGELEELDP